MATSETPICDLIERLLSTGMSTPDVLAAARPTEAALLRPTTSRASTSEDRERWKGQKKRQRGVSTRGVLDSRNKDSVQGREEKNPGVDISSDGWPVDFVEVFWKAFPPYRRQSKVKVGQKLARIRSAGEVSWEVLHGGLLRFSATNPGEYAPAPMVWLNDGRWDREYGPKNGGRSNGQTASAGAGKTGFSGIAARIRGARGGDDELQRGPPPPDHEPGR